MSDFSNDDFAAYYIRYTQANERSKKDVQSILSESFKTLSKE